MSMKCYEPYLIKLCAEAETPLIAQHLGCDIQAFLITPEWEKQVGELPTAKASWLPGSSSIAIRRWSYRLSPGVTFHGSRGRLLQNIDCCIDIPIMGCTAHWTLPAAYIQWHCFHLGATNRAGLRRRVPTADLFDLATIPFSLVP